MSQLLSLVFLSLRLHFILILLRKIFQQKPKDMERFQLNLATYYKYFATTSLLRKPVLLQNESWKYHYGNMISRALRRYYFREFYAFKFLLKLFKLFLNFLARIFTCSFSFTPKYFVTSIFSRQGGSRSAFALRIGATEWEVAWESLESACWQLGQCED